jgi:hypothetical protein
MIALDPIQAKRLDKIRRRQARRVIRAERWATFTAWARGAIDVYGPDAAKLVVLLVFLGCGYGLVLDEEYRLVLTTRSTQKAEIARERIQAVKEYQEATEEIEAAINPPQQCTWRDTFTPQINKRT